MFLAVVQWSPNSTPTVLISHHRNDLLREIARHIHAHQRSSLVPPALADGDLSCPEFVTHWLDLLRADPTGPSWTVYGTTQCLPNTGALEALPSDAAAACVAII